MGKAFEFIFIILIGFRWKIRSVIFVIKFHNIRNILEAFRNIAPSPCYDSLQSMAAQDLSKVMRDRGWEVVNPSTQGVEPLDPWACTWSAVVAAAHLLVHASKSAACVFFSAFESEIREIREGHVFF